MRENGRDSGIFPVAVLAAAILVISGAGYRKLAAHYARPSDSVAIPPGTLGGIPLEMGGWMGSDRSLDERVVNATDTDDHINRVYQRFGTEAVALFVGYGVNLRDLAPHRPEVCYPGAGWTHDDTRRITLDIVDARTLTCQIHRFRRGGLVTEKVVVLNYYIVDGQTCPDVSLLRSRAWKRQGHAAYSAQVQIVCSGEMNDEKAEKLVRDFASDSSSIIQSVIADAVRQTDDRDAGA